MNLSVNNHNIFLIIAITFIVGFIATIIVKKIAIHIDAMDIPNNRSVHTKPMPRMGGLAIFIAFLVGYMLYGDINNQMISILIGSFILIITGIIDDIKPIRAKYKLFMQIIASLIVVFYGQIFFTNIRFAGVYIEFNQFFSYFLSAFFIVAITNAINLIDGLDGLAAGVSSIYFMTIAIIAFILNKATGLDIILSTILVGGTLGFLIHNFPPAKIFMGDTGSMFLGFMVSVVALLGFKVATLTSLVVPILILSIPIIDTTFAILRRVLNKRNIGEADKEHLHHQLLKLKLSNRSSILIIYVMNILFSAVSILYVLGDAKVAIILYILLLTIILAIVLKTDILFKRNGKK